jgi:hypothetical protein
MEGNAVSMEMWVLSDRGLKSASEWQVAVDAEGYPLKFASDVQLQAHSGFLPAHLRGELTGFECNHFSADEFLPEMREQLPGLDLGRDWKFVLAFRWLGSKEAELLAAWMAATAYAQATDGVILDGEEGKVFTPVEGRQLVHDLGHP